MNQVSVRSDVQRALRIDRHCPAFDHREYPTVARGCISPFNAQKQEATVARESVESVRVFRRTLETACRLDSRSRSIACEVSVVHWLPGPVLPDGTESLLHRGYRRNPSRDGKKRPLRHPLIAPRDRGLGR